MIPIYLINLPDETTRFEAVRRQVSLFDGARLVRVEAVRGKLIPDAACRLLTRNKWSVNHKGTLGCFLSHLRSWELIAAGNDAFGLIIEDDVELRSLDRLAEIQLPADCDLLWCNGRTAYPSENAAAFRPIFPALAYIEQHGRAIGGDAYLMTKQGAKTLLSFVEADSLFTHVDLRLMAYSLTLEEGVSARDLGGIANGVSMLRATYPAKHKLTAYSYWPPISIHLPLPSQRAAEDQLGERLIV